MSTGQRWTVGAVLAVIGTLLSIILAVWGGGLRAGQAIAISCEAKHMAERADIRSQANTGDIREMKADLRHIVSGIDEIKARLK